MVRRELYDLKSWVGRNVTGPFPAESPDQPQHEADYYAPNHSYNVQINHLLLFSEYPAEVNRVTWDFYPFLLRHFYYIRI